MMRQQSSEASLPFFFFQKYFDQLGHAKVLNLSALDISIPVNQVLVVLNIPGFMNFYRFRNWLEKMLKTCTGRNKLHLASIKTCCQKKALLIGLFSYYLVHQYFGIDNIDLLRVNLFIVLIRRSSITKFFFWKKIQKKKKRTTLKLVLMKLLKKTDQRTTKKFFVFQYCCAEGLTLYRLY